MSLLQQLPYTEYKKVIGALTLEQCQVIANLANVDLVLKQSDVPGETLLKILDRSGCSLEKYRQFLQTALSSKVIKIYYKPECKVAILIANDKYQHLSKLITPSIDCESLAAHLKGMGFIVVTIKNTISKDLKRILSELFNLIPENCYCFMFYAGHGCELCNTKCMLGVDCPPEDIQLSHCVTENFVLREVNKCKPELSIMIMDMCRLSLNRNTNPGIFISISEVEEYTIHKNSLIAYSTQSAHSAYEVLQIECSESIDNNMTYELRPGDTGRIVPQGSQYVNALCERLGDGLDVSALLDKVHEDVETSVKKQRPIKLQCGVVKRSLYDPPTATNSVEYVYAEAECPKSGDWYICEQKLSHQIRTEQDCIQKLIHSQEIDETCVTTPISLTKEALLELDDQHYAITFPLPTKVKTSCQQEQHIILKGSYVVTIPQHCSIRSPHFTIININNKIRGQPLKIMSIPLESKHEDSNAILKMSSINLRNLEAIEQKLSMEKPIEINEVLAPSFYHTTIPLYLIPTLHYTYSEQAQQPL